jgi:uncharacterized integral membrane protein
MARTKRASSKRTGTRKASTRRAGTKRSSTRRTGARKKSAKRTSTRSSSARRTTSSRRKKSTGSRKPKGLRLTRKKQRQILIIVGVIVALLLLIGFLQNTHLKSVQKKAGTVGEISRNAVYGKVTSINVGPVRKAIRVRSLTTGRAYTFYVGWRTKFSPDRWPSSGETVKVYYIYDRGYLKATRVRLY